MKSNKKYLWSNKNNQPLLKPSDETGSIWRRKSDGKIIYIPAPNLLKVEIPVVRPAPVVESDPDFSKYYPSPSEPFSEREWKDGVFERAGYRRGFPKDEELMVVTPDCDGVPLFGLVIPRIERPVVACVFVRLESEKKGNEWILKRMQIAPGCMRSRSLIKYPTRVLVRQSAQQDWLRSIFLNRVKWAPTEASRIQWHDLEVENSFMLSRHLIDLPAESRIRNLAISLMLPFWTSQKIRLSERIAQLEQLGFKLQPKLDDQVFGVVLKRLGLEIVRI